MMKYPPQMVVSFWLMLLVTTRNVQADDDIEIFCSSGETVVLPCNFNIPTPPPDTPAYDPFLLQWSRTDLDYPIYIAFGPYPPYIDDRYTGRISTGPGTNLRIERVRPEDDAWYKCQIIMLAGTFDDMKNGTLTHLVVIVPPGEVILWETKNRPIISDGQQFNATQSKLHTFYCRAAGTKPAATIEWYLGDQKITNGVVKYDPQVQSENEELFDTESALNIEIERAYHLQNLECRVTTAWFTNTRYVKLLVTGPPDDPEIQTGGYQLREEVEARFVCTASNAYPAPRLRWYNNDHEISERANLQLTKNLNGRFNAISILTLVPTRVDNHNTIKCLVQHESLSEPYPVDKLILDVDFCPNSVSLTCPDSIVSGQYAVVTCRSASSNPRTGFSWTIGGTTINPTGSRRYDTDENEGETTTQSHVGTYSKSHDKAEVVCCGRTTDSLLTCNDDTCDRCMLDVHFGGSDHLRSSSLVLYLVVPIVFQFLLNH